MAMAHDSRHDDQVHVRVRSRRTVSAGGESRVELTVPCREKGIDVPLAECGRCERCVGLTTDSETEGVEIACTPLEDSSSVGLPADTRRSAEATPISEIMTTDVVCLKKDVTIATLGPTMLGMDVSGAAVVDDDGRPIGVLSQSDLLAWLFGADLEHDADAMDQTVEVLMTSPPLCLFECDTVAQAAALMAFESIHRIPVVSAEGRLTGMLSPLDVLGWLARENGYVVGPKAHGSRSR